MKLINQDFKKGTVTLKLTDTEDAYHLLKLIAPEDLIQGRTERKIRLGEADEKGSVIKKSIWIEIKVEKTGIDGSTIRVNGTVTEEAQDIPKGSHQSISLEIGDDAKLTKPTWGIADRKRLEMAIAEQPSNILAIIFDREEAIFAKLTHAGFRIYMREQGDVSRKEYGETGERKDKFFKSLAAVIAEQDTTLHPSSIILASPAFWKEYLLKELPQDIAKKASLATVSSCDETSFQELLKRPELESILAQDRNARDEKAIENALQAIRNGLACYGMDDLEQAARDGNLSQVFVSEASLGIQETDLSKKERLERLMSAAEAVGASINIITSERAQKQLCAFAGTIGVMRWKTSAEPGT